MKPTNLGTSIAAAAAAVARGQIIAYPTEGVFGLGCNPNNTTAVASLLALKQRASEKGLILIAASQPQLSPYIAPLPAITQTKLAQSWPGPVTWILPAADGTDALLTGGRPTLAARVTAHEPAAQLCDACGHALVSTSANLTGHAPGVSAAEVQNLFSNLEYYLDLPVGELDGPTPIFDGVSGKQLR